MGLKLAARLRWFQSREGSVTLEMFGSIEDPDEPGLCGAEHVVSGSAAGDCKPAVAFWSLVSRRRADGGHVSYRAFGNV